MAPGLQGDVMSPIKYLLNHENLQHLSELQQYFFIFSGAFKHQFKKGWFRVPQFFDHLHPNVSKDRFLKELIPLLTPSQSPEVLSLIFYFSEHYKFPLPFDLLLVLFKDHPSEYIRRYTLKLLFPFNDDTIVNLIYDQLFTLEFDIPYLVFHRKLNLNRFVDHFNQSEAKNYQLEDAFENYFNPSYEYTLDGGLKDSLILPPRTISSEEKTDLDYCLEFLFEFISVNQVPQIIIESAFVALFKLYNNQLKTSSEACHRFTEDEFKTRFVNTFSSLSFSIQRKIFHDLLRYSTIIPCPQDLIPLLLPRFLLWDLSDQLELLIPTSQSRYDLGLRDFQDYAKLFTAGLAKEVSSDNILKFAPFLLKFPHIDAQEAYLHLLKTSSSDLFSAEVLSAISPFKLAEALPYAQTLLDSSKFEARKSAAEFLTQFGVRDFSPHIIKRALKERRLEKQALFIDYAISLGLIKNDKSLIMAFDQMPEAFSDNLIKISPFLPREKLPILLTPKMLSRLVSYKSLGDLPKDVDIRLIKMVLTAIINDREFTQICFELELNRKLTEFVFLCLSRGMLDSLVSTFNVKEWVYLFNFFGNYSSPNLFVPLSFVHSLGSNLKSKAVIFRILLQLQQLSDSPDNAAWDFEIILRYLNPDNFEAEELEKNFLHFLSTHFRYSNESVYLPVNQAIRIFISLNQYLQWFSIWEIASSRIYNLLHQCVESIPLPFFFLTIAKILPFKEKKKNINLLLKEYNETTIEEKIRRRGIPLEELKHIVYLSKLYHGEMDFFTDQDIDFNKEYDIHILKETLPSLLTPDKPENWAKILILDHSFLHELITSLNLTRPPQQLLRSTIIQEIFTRWRGDTRVISLDALQCLDLSNPLSEDVLNYIMQNRLLIDLDILYDFYQTKNSSILDLIWYHCEDALKKDTFGYNAPFTFLFRFVNLFPDHQDKLYNVFSHENGQWKASSWEWDNFLFIKDFDRARQFFYNQLTTSSSPNPSQDLSVLLKHGCLSLEDLISLDNHPDIKVREIILSELAEKMAEPKEKFIQLAQMSDSFFKGSIRVRRSWKTGLHVNEDMEKALNDIPAKEQIEFLISALQKETEGILRPVTEASFTLLSHRGVDTGDDLIDDKFLQLEDLIQNSFLKLPENEASASIKRCLHFNEILAVKLLKSMLFTKKLTPKNVKFLIRLLETYFVPSDVPSIVNIWKKYDMINKEIISVLMNLCSSNVLPSLIPHAESFNSDLLAQRRGFSNIQELTQAFNQGKLEGDFPELSRYISILNRAKSAYPLISALGALGDYGNASSALLIQNYLDDRRSTVVNAANKALLSLAHKYDFDTVDMFMANLMDIITINELFEVKHFQGYDIYYVWERNMIKIRVSKANKELKSIPLKIRKSEVYTHFNLQKKIVENLLRKEKRSLEVIFMNQDQIPLEKFVSSYRMKVFQLNASRLIWEIMTNNQIINRGIPITSNRFVDSHGSEFDVKNDNIFLRISHPITMEQDSILEDWQNRIIEEKIVQPFKQVFRERFYLSEEDIDDSPKSFRFLNKVKGFIFHERQAYALCKELDLDYKIFYKSMGISVQTGLFIQRHGIASFSDHVLFTNSNNQPIPLEKVPPVALSETFRKLDLIATIPVRDELPRLESKETAFRASNLGKILKTWKIKKLLIKGQYAIVTGSLAKYKIHLGTSNVFLLPSEQYICIQPARVSKKVNFFLPFEEMDRMDALIISKIFLLLNDRKINDPVILAQLSR